MTRNAIRWGLLAACLAFAACESPAGQVTVLTSDTTAVTPGSSYAWAPPPQSGKARDPRVDNDIIRGRIKEAVDASLAAKGYRQVSDTGSATLLVAYHLGVQTKTEYQVDTYGGGPGRVACGFRGCVGAGWGMYGPPITDVRNVDYTQGTLMVDVIDRASGKLAWRATSKKRVDGGDATQAGISAIVADMVKTLPGSAPTKG